MGQYIRWNKATPLQSECDGFIDLFIHYVIWWLSLINFCGTGLLKCFLLITKIFGLLCLRISPSSVPRESTQAKRTLRRQDKKLKELMSNIEEERKQGESHKAQVCKRAPALCMVHLTCWHIEHEELPSSNYCKLNTASACLAKPYLWTSYPICPYQPKFLNSVAW